MLMPFGKYKWQELSKIPTGYLRWLLKDAQISSALRTGVEATLARRDSGETVQSGLIPLNGRVVPEREKIVPEKLHRWV